MQKFTILVVDDDPAIRKMLSELLAGNENYKVLLAGDSKEAVTAFYSQPRIDVVLTDIHMPDHTGLEMVADMKTVDFEPEILVMTANGNPENVEKARKIGARSMILKPFDNLDVIEAEIRKAVEAAAEKRGEKLQDDVTASTPVAAPTEEPTEKLTEEPTEEPTIELPEEPIEEPTVRLTSELTEELTEESTEELTELAEDEVIPPVPAPAIDLPERPTIGEISAPQLTRTYAGNRHHVPQKTADPKKDMTDPQNAEATPAAEDAKTTPEETAPEIPAELKSIFHVSADLDVQGLKLQVPIVCLQTLEEQDAIDALRRLASKLKRKLYTWSATRGIADGAGKTLAQADVKPVRARGFRRLFSKLNVWSSKRKTVDKAGKILAQAHLDPIAALEFIGRQTRDSMFILADFGRCLEDPKIVRTLREMVMEGRTARTMVVLTAPRMIIPPELESSCEVFDWPASEEHDIEAVFEQVRNAMEATVGRPISLDADERETMLERLKGMSAGRVRFEIARALMKTPN